MILFSRTLKSLFFGVFYAVRNVYSDGVHVRLDHERKYTSITISISCTSKQTSGRLPTSNCFNSKCLRIDVAAWLTHHIIIYKSLHTR